MGWFSREDVHGFSFHIRTEGIPYIWILLEIQSTVNIFSNGYLQKNIRERDRCINILGNTVVLYNNLIGYMTGYPDPIRYDLKGISKILSIVLVEKYSPVTYRMEKFFKVDKGGSNNHRFIRSE